jgi:hypothetical protein
MRTIIAMALVLGVSVANVGSATAQWPSDTEKPLRADQLCLKRAQAEVNPTLDDPNRPFALDEALHQYRIRLNVAFEKCMIERGFKARINLERCKADGYFRSTIVCYELIS